VSSAAILYVLGGSLEAAGILFVALDLGDALRDLRNGQLNQESVAGRDYADLRAQGRSYNDGPANTSNERLDRLEHNVGEVRQQTENVANAVLNVFGKVFDLPPLIDKKVAGNLSRRAFGIGVLLVGLGVQTAGNLVAL
jgi:hypothetical protein